MIITKRLVNRFSPHIINLHKKNIITNQQGLQTTEAIACSRDSDCGLNSMVCRCVFYRRYYDHGMHGMQVCILSAILWPWYAWYAGVYCYGEILDWCHPLMMNVWVNCIELKLTFKILCLDIYTCRMATAGAGGWCVCRWDLRMCLLFIRWCTLITVSSNTAIQPIIFKKWGGNAV